MACELGFARRRGVQLLTLFESIDRTPAAIAAGVLSLWVLTTPVRWLVVRPASVGEMGRRGTHWGVVRAAAGLVCAVLVLGGCSSDEPLPAVLLPSPSTLTSAASTTTTTALAGAVASTGSTTIPPLVGFLSPSIAFDRLATVDPTLEVLELAAGDIDQLEARFTADERLQPFMAGVDARAVRVDGALVAVGLSVAVEPEALLDLTFAESFIDGATSGGIVNTLPEAIGPERLTAWIADDAGNLLWQHENLFVLLTGRDLLEVRALAEVMVGAVLDVPLDEIRDGS